MTKIMKIFDDRPDQFWILMGPMFASPKVRRELPYMRDEPNYVWFLAVADDGVLNGFASLHSDDQGGHLHGLYVKPEARGDGIARELLEKRLAYLGAIGVNRVDVTANGRSRPLLESCGFVEIKKRGQYSVMVKS